MKIYTTFHRFANLSDPSNYFHVQRCVFFVIGLTVFMDCFYDFCGGQGSYCGEDVTMFEEDFVEFFGRLG